MTLSYLLSMGGAAFLADALGIRAVFIGAGMVTALAVLPALTIMTEPKSGSPHAPDAARKRLAERSVEV
jgi:predicted MFS family arabinose efflux permease